MVLFLETCTAEVSSGRTISLRRQAFSGRGSGPQGLRRPRFSFFRFTCQTAREPWRSPFPVKPGSRRSPNLPTEIGRLVTVSVRSFAGAPSRRKAGRRAVVEALYGRPLHLVNSKCPQSSPQV